MTMYIHAARHFPLSHFLFFFFKATATTEIYTLSLHDALPISASAADQFERLAIETSHPPWLLESWVSSFGLDDTTAMRSEEHTSELQSLTNLVCRLLLEKKKPNTIDPVTINSQ